VRAASTGSPVRAVSTGSRRARCEHSPGVRVSRARRRTDAFCRECVSEHITRALAATNDDANAAKCPLCRATTRRTELFALRRMLPPAAAAAEEAAAQMAAAAAEQQSSTAHSTKTALVLRAVREMIDAEGPQAKCLVYSCYTKYLDVVQAALGGAGHACARLDGGMRMRERERQMAAFHTDGVRVLLMVRAASRIERATARHRCSPAVVNPPLVQSLKCGVGLNLTAATTVVLCEPWHVATRLQPPPLLVCAALSKTAIFGVPCFFRRRWNPFVEEQGVYAFPPVAPPLLPARRPPHLPRPSPPHRNELNVLARSAHSPLLRSLWQRSTASTASGRRGRRV
jgi:hypothetical protein